MERWKERRRQWTAENPEYRSWSNMKNRCYNKRDPKWELYGGRGIVVCKRWHSFAEFLKDMGRRPERSSTLERIDNNGNYEPGNCRWASRIDQARNRRTTRSVTCRGETMSLARAAELSVVSYATLAARLNRGWDTERAMFSPLRGQDACHC